MTTVSRICFIAVALLWGSTVLPCRHDRAAEGGPPDLLPTVGSIERLDPRNRVNRWKQGEGLTVHLEPAGFTGLGAYGSERGSNGLTLDRQGCLISCEHGDRRVSRLTPGGGKRTIADNYEGKRFNSPNDCAVHSSGAIYFTDPPYGLPKGFEDPARELGFCGVYRIAPDGTIDAGRTFFDGTKLFRERKKDCPTDSRSIRRATCSPPGPAACSCSPPTAPTWARCSPARPRPIAASATMAKRSS